MKRKFLALSLIALTIFSLTACNEKIYSKNDKQPIKETINTEKELELESNEENKETNDNSNSTGIVTQEQIDAGKTLIENSTTVFKDIPEGMIIEKEYILGNFGKAGSVQINALDTFSTNKIEYAYVVTNNTGKEVAYDLEIEAVDIDGKTIEDDTNYGYIMEQGESVFLKGEICLDADEVSKVDHLVVELDESVTDKISLNSEVSFTYEIAQDEEFTDRQNLKIVTTNNSDYEATCIWAYYILFDENKNIIDIGHQGWSDILKMEDYPELKPGANGTITKLYTEKDKTYFYDYEIYIDSYRTIE